jgi:molecular chaperone GrpE
MQHMTERNDIIDDGTDGLGEGLAGSGTPFGRTTSDPAEAETVSGSTGASPPTSQEVGGDSNSAADAVEDELDELAKAVAERDEFKDLALRAKADFENYRKRADKRVAETRGVAVAGVLRELLPVVDNLDRAIEASGGGEALIEGVRLVHADLHSILDRIGLTAIDPTGEAFDPALHEAISQAPVEGVAQGTIIEVVQKGFMLGDSVVRPARVVVAA